MLVVVFDAVDYYGSAGALLDQGFNTPVAAEANLDHLPAIVADASLPPPTTVPAVVPGRRPHGRGKSIFDSTAFALLVLVVGLLPLRALRRRVVARDAPLATTSTTVPPIASATWCAAVVSALDGVPDQRRVVAAVEQQVRGVVLVDVADEAVVDAVADELAQPREKRRAMSIGMPSCWFSCWRM